jgi:hypothetical protein
MAQLSVQVWQIGHTLWQTATIRGVVAGLGCFDSEEILTCDESDITTTITLPKPLTSPA